MSAVLVASIRVGLALLLFMPLVVTFQTIFPYIVGKALYARGLIEIMTALWIILAVENRSYLPPRSWVLFAFYIYLLVSIIAAATGVDFNRSLWSTYERMMGVWDLVHWFLLVVVASAVLRTAGQWHVFLNANLMVGLVLSILALAQGLGVRVLPTILPGCRVDVTLGNPSYLAAILVVQVLLAIGLLTCSFLPSLETPTLGTRATPQRTQGQERQTRRGGQWKLLGMRLFWGATALLGLVALFLTGTRGAMVGLVAGTVTMPLAVLLFTDRRILKPVSLAGGVTLLAVAALFLLDRTVGLPTSAACKEHTIGARTATSLEPGTFQRDTLRPRLLSARIGFQAWLDRPLLGWGPENYIVVFSRYVEPKFFSSGLTVFDQAHNKVVEETATKGLLGLLSYLALWGVMVWAVVRRRRPPKEEALAYAFLGALAGYFVQNLFLFDTPGMMLQWAVLVSWIAAQERFEYGLQRPGQKAWRGVQQNDDGTRLIPSLWGRATVYMTVTALLIFSLVALNYRPFRASQLAFQALVEPLPLERTLEIAKESFNTFPPLANNPRSLVFESLANRWGSLNPEQRERAFLFLIEEGNRALAAEPDDYRILSDIVFFLQLTAGSPENLHRIDALLERLGQLGPGRVETYQLKANQALLLGDYQEALHIVDEFLTQAPVEDRFLERVKQIAQENLKSQRQGQ